MWPSQQENSHLDCATTAANVTHITSCRKTGEDLKSAQKTTSQKSHSLSPLSIAGTPLLYTNLALTGWNLSLFLWERLLTAPFRASEVLMAAPICSPIRNFKIVNSSAELDR